MAKQCRNREVTLSLVVAAAGFVIPFERLNSEHPAGDEQRYPECARQLSVLLSGKFLGSILHPQPETVWAYDNLKTIEGDPDGWGLQAKPLTPGKTVGGVLRVIRNAMAHGNLFTRGNPIETILFASAHRNDAKEIVAFSVISVTPEAFLLFLRNWFEFIKQQDVSQFDVWSLVGAT